MSDSIDVVTDDAFCRRDDSEVFGRRRLLRRWGGKVNVLDRNVLIDYSLGRLSPDEAKALEERAQTDVELANALEALRNELSLVDAPRRMGNPFRRLFSNRSSNTDIAKSTGSTSEKNSNEEHDVRSTTSDVSIDKCADASLFSQNQSSQNVDVRRGVKRFAFIPKRVEAPRALDSSGLVFKRAALNVPKKELKSASRELPSAHDELRPLLARLHESFRLKDSISTVDAAFSTRARSLRSLVFFNTPSPTSEERAARFFVDGSFKRNVPSLGVDSTGFSNEERRCYAVEGLTSTNGYEPLTFCRGEVVQNFSLGEREPGAERLNVPFSGLGVYRLKPLAFVPTNVPCAEIPAVPTSETIPVLEPEPVVEPVAEPIPTLEPEPVVEPVAEPIPTLEPEPVVEPVAESIPALEPEPVAESIPVGEPVSVAEPVFTVEQISVVEPEELGLVSESVEPIVPLAPSLELPIVDVVETSSLEVREASAESETSDVEAVEGTSEEVDVAEVPDVSDVLEIVETPELVGEVSESVETEEGTLEEERASVDVEEPAVVLEPPALVSEELEVLEKEETPEEETLEGEAWEEETAEFVEPVSTSDLSIGVESETSQSYTIVRLDEPLDRALEETREREEEESVLREELQPEPLPEETSALVEEDALGEASFVAPTSAVNYSVETEQEEDDFGPTLSAADRQLAELLGREPTTIDLSEYYWEDYDEDQDGARSERSSNILSRLVHDAFMVATAPPVLVGRATIGLYRKLVPRGIARSEDFEDPSRSSKRRKTSKSRISDMMLSMIIGMSIAVFVVFPTLRLVVREVFVAVAKSRVRQIGGNVTLSPQNSDEDLVPFITEQLLFPQYETVEFNYPKNENDSDGETTSSESSEAEFPSVETPALENEELVPILEHEP